MTKKLILMFAPVLVLAAFSVIPAMASAATREYGTEAGGVFTAFAGNTKVVSKKATGSGNFILETEVSKEKVECSTFSDEGTVKNVAGVGKSVDELRFDDCKIVTGALKGCGVNSLGTSTEDINGIVTDEVNAAGNGVKITVKEGFELEVPGTVLPACPETVLGAVSGSAEGLQAAKSDKLVFTKAKGLKFLGEESNITGSDETTTETGAKAVVIN